ncbi:response regulator transcription factor [bacterium]|nr:response regulator transcription factor [bacterium]
MTIRTVIVDDEKLARSRLRRMLAEHPEIEITGEAANGWEALTVIQELQPHLVFLDIRMPLLSGFEMLEQLGDQPYVIFTTAYNEYALRAFEENTVDYLMKPIAAATLARAVAKAAKIIPDHSAPSPFYRQVLDSIIRHESRLRRFSVKQGDTIRLIDAAEVLYFSAEDKYTFINTADLSDIIPFTLKELEDRLDPDVFLRVHRGTIVNVNSVQTIQKWFGGKYKLLFANGKDAIVSANYVKFFKEKIGL